MLTPMPIILLYCPFGLFHSIPFLASILGASFQASPAQPHPIYSASLNNGLAGLGTADLSSLHPLPTTSPTNIPSPCTHALHASCRYTHTTCAPSHTLFAGAAPPFFTPLWQAFSSGQHAVWWENSTNQLSLPSLFLVGVVSECHAHWRRGRTGQDPMENLFISDRPIMDREEGFNSPNYLPYLYLLPYYSNMCGMAFCTCSAVA